MSVWGETCGKGRCENCLHHYLQSCGISEDEDTYTKLTEKEALKLIKRGNISDERFIKAIFKEYPNVERKMKLDKINEKI